MALGKSISNDILSPFYLHFSLRDGPVDFIRAGDEVRQFDKNRSVDFKLQLNFCTNNSLSFKDSHDSSTALIQLHNSQNAHWRRKK